MGQSKFTSALAILLTSCAILAILWFLLPGGAQASVLWQEHLLAKARHQPAEAAAALREMVTLRPWRVDLYEVTGSFELEAGNLVSAMEAFENGYQIDVLSPDGTLQLAQLLIDAGKTARAREILLQFIITDKLDSSHYLRAVNQLKNIGQPADVLAGLREWLDFEPTSANALYLLGVYLALDDPAGSLLALEQAALKDESYRSNAERLLGALDSAAREQGGGRSALQVGRGLLEVNEWQAAEVALEKAVASQPDLAEGWAFLAEVHQNQGKPAREEIDRALALSPESTIVQAVSAVYWRRLGKPELGLVYLHAAANQEPATAYWQMELGKTLCELNNPLDALAHFIQGTELEPKNAQTWIELARFSLNYGIEPAQIGLPAARQAVLLAPNDSSALDLMGALFFLQNDLASAERFLQQSLQQDAANADAHLHLGQVFLATGDLNSARSHLDEVLRLSSETAVGKLAERLIQQNFSSP